MRKGMTLRYAGLQGFYWMGFATVSGFASVYLTDAGYRNAEIGGIIAAAGILSALAQPVAASAAERGGRCGLKELLGAAGGALVLLGALLWWLKTAEGPSVLRGLLYGASLVLLQLAMPLVNAAGTQAINAGARVNFGAARGAGSIAYAGAAWVLGQWTARRGAGAVAVLMVVSFGLLLGALAAYPLERHAEEPGRAEGGRGNPVAFLRKYPGFGTLLVGLTLIYVGHSILNSYTYQIVQGKGGGSGEMGTAAALSACWELPVMFLFTRLAGRAESGFWLRVSGVFFTLKALASWAAPDVGWYYGAQVFQTLGWGLMAVALVYYINEHMGREDAIKGQACATMTYTLGSVLGALAGGALLDWSGVDTLLGWTVGVTLAGAAVVFWAVGRIRRG